MILEMFSNQSDPTSKENTKMQCSWKQKSTNRYRKFSVKSHSICFTQFKQSNFMLIDTHTNPLQEKSHTVLPLNNKTQLIPQHPTWVNIHHSESSDVQLILNQLNQVLAQHNSDHQKKCQTKFWCFLQLFRIFCKTIDEKGRKQMLININEGSNQKN